MVSIKRTARQIVVWVLLVCVALNTRGNVLALAVAAAVGLQGIPCAFGADANLLIVGDMGQLLSLSISGSNRQATPVDLPSLGGRIIEASLASSAKKLFVTTDDAKSYELDLSGKLNGYQRIQTTNDLPFCIWYDRRENRPAWLHLGDNESAKQARFLGKDNRIRASRSEDIEFSKGFVFGMHIDGWKTSSSLAAMHSHLTFLPTEYPDAQWIIVGRSESVAVYGRKMVGLIEVGKPFKATYLFHDRARSQWHVQTFEERCDVAVFEDVAAVRGINDLRGDKDSATGNDIQGKPSGNWYFYVAQENAVTSYELDPSLTVQYATARKAILSGNGQVLILGLDPPHREKPELLIELPTGFSVIAVCPLWSRPAKGSP